MNLNLALFKYLLFSLIILNVLSVNAFTLIRDGNGVTTTGWSGSNLTFDIDPSCNAYSSYVNSAINVAADVWGRVPNSSLTVNLGSAVSLPQTITHYVGNTADSYAPNGNTIVYCDINFGANSGLDANSIPGFATGQNMSSTGTILGCLLVLNVEAAATASITNLSTTIVNTVLTHEIGHCLGLGHSSDTNSLMYYATGAGRGTYLSQDDIDGVNYLYPKQDFSNTGFKGCSALASAPPSKPFRGGFFASIFHFIGADLLQILFTLMLFQVLQRIWQLRIKIKNRL